MTGAEAQTTMSQVLASLKQARSRALAAVNASWDFFGNSKEANLYFLNVQAPKLMGILESQQAEVLAGKRSFETWMESARILWNQLKSTSADVGNWAFSGVVASTVSATAAQVKELPKDAEFSIWGLAILAVALLFLRILI